LVRILLVLLGLLLPVNLADSIPAVGDVKRFGWSAMVETDAENQRMVINRTMRHGYTHGLLTGDRLLQINGEAADSAAVARLRQVLSAGDTIALLVEREGRSVELRIPVADNSASYSGYFWYRLFTALAGWGVGMLLIVWRGARPEALLLGGALILLTPITVSSGVHASGLLADLARTGWHLQAAAHRFVLPALLLHFMVRAAGRPRWLRGTATWLGIYALLFIVLALITDAFRAPMAWGQFGPQRDLRAAAGLIFEVMALGIAWRNSRIRQGLPLAVRWICLSTLAIAAAGTLRALLSLSMGEANVPEFFWRMHGLVLILLPTTAALYLAVPQERVEGGLAERRRLTYWITTMLTGLYGLVITGAAAVVLSSIGHSLSGAEWVLFGSIFSAAILFSPILRWSWEFVDRRIFSRWVALETAAQALIQRLSAELEPARIARLISNEVPELLGLSTATLILGREPTALWDLGNEPGLTLQPNATLRTELKNSRDPGEITLIPIENPDGTLIGALRLEVGTDGRELDAAGHSVARTLAQGTSFALHNAESYLKLRRAQQDLADAERITSLGTLAGGLAHEIKNPLAALKMGLYLLERDGTDPRKLHRIQRDIRRIDDLVSGLLRFTHAGLRDEPTTIELHDLLDECIADFQPFAEDHEIQVENDYTIDELRVLGSPSQLRVLISNLLRNALDAAGFAGTIRIETRICGQQIEIDVQDSGPGIPAGLEERIFELSFSTKPGGTGLGLALARREAEQLGGQIKILPAPGQGTLLRVVLPRVI
jgi:signal transduction histidine kinase